MCTGHTPGALQAPEQQTPAFSRSPGDAQVALQTTRHMEEMGGRREVKGGLKSTQETLRSAAEIEDTVNFRGKMVPEDTAKSRRMPGHAGFVDGLEEGLV